MWASPLNLAIDPLPLTHTYTHSSPTSSPLAHSLSSSSAFPRDAQTFRANRLEDRLLTDVQSLRSGFLAKYFQLLLSCDSQTDSRRLDLSQCDLCDADLLKASFLASFLYFIYMQGSLVQ